MSPEVLYWFWERTTVNCFDKKGSPMITWTKGQFNTLCTVLFQCARIFKEATKRSFMKWGSSILIVMKTHSTCYCGLQSQIEFRVHQKFLIFFSVAVSRVRYFVGDSVIIARRRFDFSVCDVKIAGNSLFFVVFLTKFWIAQKTHFHRNNYKHLASKTYAIISPSVVFWSSIPAN